MSVKVAIFVPTLSGGGMERAIINIANLLFNNGYDVDLLLASCKGSLFDELDSNINVVCLNQPPYTQPILYDMGICSYKEIMAMLIARIFKILPKPFKVINSIREYISKQRPEIIISTPATSNLAMVIACSGATSTAKLILREANTLSVVEKNKSRFITRLFLKRLDYFYSRAEKIVCVSEGVRKDLVDNYHVSPDNCIVLYNPVNEELLFKKAACAVVRINGFAHDLPYYLAMGRLEQQKGFDLLIKAFAKIHKKVSHNLLILGEGPERASLEKIIAEHNLKGRVFLPGFESNPYPYLKNCDVFVLSSRWEGLANVLREAIAFNKDIVATDCPSGTREILSNYPKSIITNIDYEEIAKSMLKAIDGFSANEDHANDLEDRNFDYLRFINSL